MGQLIWFPFEDERCTQAGWRLGRPPGARILLADRGHLLPRLTLPRANHHEQSKLFEEILALRSERLIAPGVPLLDTLLHELEAQQDANTTEWGSCEELLYPIKKPAGRDRGPSDPHTTIHSVLLPGPAPA